jgi:tetratricopeptide (TPR) repeat protein
LRPNAQAYAVLAYILLLQSFEASNADEARTFLVRAKECARRGLELDDSEIHCHAVIGQVYGFERRYDEATYHMERAVALNPNDPFAMSRMAGLLTYLGRHDEAMAWLSKVQRIDPSPPNYFWELWARALYG